MCDQQSLGSACAYAQSDLSLCLSLEHYLSVKILTEHHLEFLSSKRGCTGSSEYATLLGITCHGSYLIDHWKCSRCVLIRTCVLSEENIVCNIILFMSNSCDIKKHCNIEFFNVLWIMKLYEAAVQQPL